MDKQSEGLKLLQEIKIINAQIDQLQEMIERVYTTLTNATVKSKEINVQTSLPADPMADKVIEVIDYQKTLEESQQQLINKRIIAINIIRQMATENQHLIMLKYFRGYTIERISDEVGYTYRWTWEKIHTAEEEFISLYEKIADV